MNLITGESGLGFAVIHGIFRGDLNVTVLSGSEWSEAFTPAHSSLPIVYPSLHAASWDFAGTRFIVVVNYVNETITAKIAGFPVGILQAEIVGENATMAVDGKGVATVNLDRCGAHVYRCPLL